MIIVIDRCFFEGDFFMHGKRYEHFWKVSSGPNDKVIVPEVVYDEVVLSYKSHLDRTCLAIRSAVSESHGVVRADDVAVLSDNFVSERVEYYVHWLVKELQRRGATVYPHPAVSQEWLVAQATRGLRPFNGQPRGFQGVLIWETLMAHQDADEAMDGLVLVTADKQVFLDDVGRWISGPTCPALRATAENQVKLCTDLDQFASVLLESRRFDDSRDAHTHVDLCGDVYRNALTFAVTSAAEEFLSERFLDGRIISLPYGVEGATVDAVDQVRILSQSTARTCGSTGIAARMQCVAGLVVSYEQSIDSSGVVHFGNWMSGAYNGAPPRYRSQVEVEVLLNIDVVVDDVAKSVTSAVVRSIDAGYEEYSVHVIEAMS